MSTPFLLIYGYPEATPVGAALTKLLRQANIAYHHLSSLLLDKLIGDIVNELDNIANNAARQLTADSPLKSNDTPIVNNTETAANPALPTNQTDINGQNNEPTSSFEYSLSKSRDSHPFILFCNMDKSLVMQLLTTFSQNNVRPIPLKAVLTENNRAWTVRQLITELKNENAYINTYQKLRQGVALLEDLDRTTYTSSSWHNLQEAKFAAKKLLENYQDNRLSDLEQALKQLTSAYFSLQTLVD